MPQLSSIDWNLPQTRKRIYIVLVKDFLATQRQLVTLMGIFERGAPSKARSARQERSDLSQVRAYVNKVLDSVGSQSILPEYSQDLGPNLGSVFALVFWESFVKTRQGKAAVKA